MAGKAESLSKAEDKQVDEYVSSATNEMSSLVMSAQTFFALHYKVKTKCIHRWHISHLSLSLLWHEPVKDVVEDDDVSSGADVGDGAS